MPTTKSEKSKGGRPSKLTPELIKEATRLADQGNYFVTIANALGIGESTFYRWLETGEADHAAGKETPHAEFWESLKKAEARAELACVRDVINAVRGWQGRAWFLERKYRERWAASPKYTVEHTGKDGGPIKTQSVPMDVSAMNDDELRTLQTVLQREAASDS